MLLKKLRNGQVEEPNVPHPLVQPAPVLADPTEIDPHDVHPGPPLQMVNQRLRRPLIKIDHDLPDLLLLKPRDPRIRVVRNGKRLAGKLLVLHWQLPSVKRSESLRQRVRKWFSIRLFARGTDVHVYTSHLLETMQATLVWFTCVLLSGLSIYKPRSADPCSDAGCRPRLGA